MPLFRRHGKHRPAADRASLRRSSAYEFLGALVGEPDTTDQSLPVLVQQVPGKRRRGIDGRGLRLLLAQIAARWVRRRKRLYPEAGNCEGGNIPASQPQPSDGNHVPLRSQIFDGRFANNAWLQELPKPITQTAWDNPVMMSVRHRRQASDRRSTMSFEIELNGQQAYRRCLAQPGHPDDSITVFLGYGRTHAGHVGTDVGFNAYKLRASERLVRGRERQKSCDGFKLATIRRAPVNRQVAGIGDPLRTAQLPQGTLDDFTKNPGFAHERTKRPRRS